MKGRPRSIEQLIDGRSIDSQYFSIRESGGRKLAAEDQRGLVLAHEAVAQCSPYAIGFAKSKRLVAKSYGATEQAAQRLVEASYNGTYRRPKLWPKKRVVAALNFFPTGQLLTILAGYGVDVLMLTLLLKTDMEDLETRLIQTWLGYPKEEKPRVLLLPRWSIMTRKIVT